MSVRDLVPLITQFLEKKKGNGIKTNGEIEYAT